MHPITKAMLAHDFKLDVIGCTSLDQRIRSGEGYIDWLFAENVLTSIGSFNTAGCVHSTRSADMQNVELTPRQECIQSMEVLHAKGFSGLCSAI